MAPKERNSLMALTKQLVIDRGMAVLFTEHSMDVVFAHADRILVLARGELIAEGPPAAVRDDPRVREVYFGGGTTFATPVVSVPVILSEAKDPGGREVRDPSLRSG
jgi:branched-chain amino acid transport system ATP-binding protein